MVTRIHTTDPSVATSAAGTISNFSPASLSDALKVTVESFTPPVVQAFAFQGPSPPPPMPPMPPMQPPPLTPPGHPVETIVGVASVVGFVLLCGCMWPLLARVLPPSVTGRLPLLKTAAARQRQRLQKKREQVADLGDETPRVADGDDTDAIVLDVSAPPSRSASGGGDAVSSQAASRCRTLSTGSDAEGAGTSRRSSTRRSAFFSVGRMGSRRTDSTKRDDPSYRSPRPPSPTEVRRKAEAFERAMQPPMPAVPYQYPGSPYSPGQQQQQQQQQHSPPSYPPHCSPYPYPYASPAYGAAYTPAFPYPPPIGANAQWQWESPRGWVLVASPPRSPQHQLQQMEEHQPQLQTEATASEGPSALATPIKFVDSCGSKAAANGNTSGTSGKVRFSTTTTTTNHEYAHDIDTGFIKELLAEAAGELRREKRELSAATLRSLKSHMADGNGRRADRSYGRRDVTGRHRRKVEHAGAEGEGRRRGGHSDGVTGEGPGGGKRGGGHSFPSSSKRRHTTPPRATGSNRKRTGERSAEASRSRPSDDQPRRARRRPPSIATPSAEQDQDAEQTDAEQTDAEQSREEGSQVIAERQQSNDVPGGCWCGTAAGVAPGWRAKTDTTSPPSDRPAGGTKPKKRSPGLGIGDYRSPRKEEEKPGARTDAATPPAPQTVEWDAVYSAINEGREEVGRGRGGTKAKKDDQSLIC